MVGINLPRQRQHFWKRMLTKCVLIINKPFKRSPFLAGFPSTLTHYNTVNRVREKPAIWGLVRLISKCLLISWLLTIFTHKNINSYFYRHRTPFRPKSNSTLALTDRKPTLESTDRPTWSLGPFCFG